MEPLSIHVFALFTTCSYGQIAPLISQSWLLGNKVVCTGHISLPMLFEEDIRTPNLEFKIRLMMAVYQHDPDTLAALETMLKKYRSMEKEKNRSRDIIIAGERLKRTISDFCDKLHSYHWNGLEQMGYGKLRQILEGDVLHLIEVNDPEFEVDNGQNIPLSRFFRYQPGDDFWPYAPYYFFVPEPIFEADVRQQVKDLAPKDVELINLPLLFLYRIPDLNLLSLAEMEKIRYDLAPVLEPLRYLLKELFSKTEAGTEVEQCHAWAMEKLAPILPPLRYAIHHHPFVQTLVKANPTLMYFDVGLNFGHYHEMYLFYKVLNELPEDTAAILEKDLERPELKKAYRPFLTARSNLEKMAYEPALEDPSWVSGTGTLNNGPGAEASPTKRKILDL